MAFPTLFIPSRRYSINCAANRRFSLSVFSPLFLSICHRHVHIATIKEVLRKQNALAQTDRFVQCNGQQLKSIAYRQSIHLAQFFHHIPTICHPPIFPTKQNLSRVNGREVYDHSLFSETQ